MKFFPFYILILLYSCNNYTKSLPIYGRPDIIENKTDNGISYDTIPHSVEDFQFLNQDSMIVSNLTFSNSIYIADFFFTTCPTICPVMKNNMIKVYEKYIDNSKVKYLSHTINPLYDNVEILSKYSDRLGVDSDTWHFVTGDLDEIYDIAKSSYMVTAIEDKNEPGGFLHSGVFLLVDNNRNIRGVYDGTDMSEVNRLINDIEVLLETIS